MRTPILMPVLGYDMAEGRIAAWLKKVGDTVRRGEPIAEVETEKATVEYESIASGTIVDILHRAGETVRVGEVIAFVDTDT